MRICPDIIMFGGTFDPPHEGHSKCLEAVLSVVPAKVIVVPSQVPPQSAHQLKRVYASYQQRLDMARLHFQSATLDHHHIEVSDIEGKLPVPSYTLQTIRALRSQKSDKTFGIVIGYDQLDRLESWYGINDLLDECDLIVINRGGENLLSRVKLLAERLQRTYREIDCGVAWKTAPTGVRIMSEEVSPLSSTQIRKGDEVVSDSALSDAVRDYIIKHHLYS